MLFFQDPFYGRDIFFTIKYSDIICQMWVINIITKLHTLFSGEPQMCDRGGELGNVDITGK